MTAAASMSGIGDSIAHGAEKSAVKNTAPDKRTTRSTSDSTSIAVVPRFDQRSRVPGASAKNPRASVNESIKSGGSDKRHRASVIGLQRRSVQDGPCTEDTSKERGDATTETRSDILSVTGDGEAVATGEARLPGTHQP